MSTVALREPKARVDMRDRKCEPPKKLRKLDFYFRREGIALFALLATSVACYDGDPTAFSSDPPALSSEDFSAGEGSWNSIQVDVNPRVEKWVNLYQGIQSEKFSDLLVRKERFDAIIQTHLRMRGMPKELVFIPMIESEYLPQAVSPASAVGLWQFMSLTAEYLGLRLDSYVDERRDPIRATEAALDYLSYLHKLRFFHSTTRTRRSSYTNPTRNHRIFISQYGILIYRHMNHIQYFLYFTSCDSFLSYI